MEQQNNLLENIKNNNPELSNLSDSELNSLMESTFQAIDSFLDKTGSVEIEDFGVFSRKKHGTNSVSSFKSAEKLNENINKE